MPYVQAKLAEAIEKSDELKAELAPLEEKVVAQQASIKTQESHAEVLSNYQRTEYRVKWLRGFLGKDEPADSH